jgi:hypothetical protein
MNRQESSFFGIFNCKNHIPPDQFYAFKGKFNRNLKRSESLNIITDEIGESFAKIWKTENDKTLLIAKDYAIKYNDDASTNIVLFAYENKNNLYCGQYSWLMRKHFPSISSIESIQKIPLANIRMTQLGNPLYLVGELSIMTFSKNKDLIMDSLPQIQTFYTENKRTPPTQKTLETCFKRIQYLPF